MPALQGFMVEWPLATPMMGFSKSPSLKPTARNIARLGERAAPSVMMCERLLSFCGTLEALQSFSPGSDEVVTTEVHHLVPRRHEVFHKLLLRVRAGIDFRESAQLRVRTEDQIDTRAGPLDRVGLAVAPLVHAVRARRLPLRAHVEQVDEEVVRQRLGPLGEDAVLGLPGICAPDA